MRHCTVLCTVYTCYLGLLPGPSLCARGGSRQGGRKGCGWKGGNEERAGKLAKEEREGWEDMDESVDMEEREAMEEGMEVKDGK
jgi:hypothetical protein